MKHKWPMVKLGEVLTAVERHEVPQPGRTYRQIGVRLWGQGAYEREPLDGSQTKYAALYRVEADDIIVNKIWARNGSVAVVPESLAGCFASSEFPVFAPNRHQLEAQWMHWLTKTPRFWAQCDAMSRGTSGKNRIKPQQFLCVEIPLPPLSEQRRIVARIEELAAQIEEARQLRLQQQVDLQRALVGAFWTIANDAPRRPMQEVAPIVRRNAELDPNASYPELGIRSFGKGTFHKPALTGTELGSKRLYRIEPGDLLFMNVFAWEGAVAVAKPEDKGRYGSHRFITCVPRKDVITANFLCFYFLTEEGLEKLGEASPGGAGRNKTLGLTTLSKIQVPVPTMDKQQWFESLLFEADRLKTLQAQTAAELDALLPAILDRAFKGEL